ncbi:hypothetical protein [Bartonella raoultii]|uniref:Genomic island protein n=1 Tax=Bartonella raoultii TaxID=1457020 RepID=A0ABS7IBR5_9HYPH|nr:hypothetical protein [Bartonella raoultii]MBX4335584.1 hypothetical protein [Bartonella raoultii]MBX4335671.1 hypothetical protein [Bartonella raoultii]MBX4336030.1 hypothetical protein [Bartonella raoultii]MBX4336376.1 hypothetical protein [Bartonella raoultii]MBX4336561.1 hypothetical protein [Bartonella raoultii]
MGFFKHLFLTNHKPPMQKKFVATIRGHAPWGLGVAEYFYNLYEYDDGMREYEEFEGGQYHEMPETVDYSSKAQVKAWIYGGDLPRSVLSCEALINEVNKKIKKRTMKDRLICEISNEGEKSYSQAYDDDIDRELEKALDIQLGKYQNRKKCKK